MADVLWTGPDGITRRVPVPNLGAPNYIAGPSGVATTNLPATTFNPRNLPVPVQQPGVPALAPQYNPGTGFTLGPSNPVQSVGRPAPLAIEYQPQLKAGSGGINGGSSVPPAGGGTPAPKPSGFARAKGLIGKSAGPMLALSATQLAADAFGADPNNISRDQYGAGAISPFDLDAVKMLKLGTGMAYDTGIALQEAAKGDDVSNFGAHARNIAGSILTSPVRLGAGMHEGTDALGKYLSDNILKSKGELKAEKAKEELAQQQATAAQASSDVDAFKGMLKESSTWQNIAGALGYGSPEEAAAQAQPQIIGDAPKNFGGYQIPLPPPGPDYSGVQAAIDQTRPDPNWEAEAEGRRRGAIITGLVGGLLSASMDSDANFGQIMASGGMGTLQGMAQGDAAKAEAAQQFKKAMDEYWIRTAGVRRDQAESDAQYANRVWETKVQQLRVNASAAEARARAGEAKLRQAGDKFYVEEVVNGKVQLRPLDVGAVNRLAGLKDTLEGMGIDAKQAGAITAEVAMRKDPTYALQMVALSRMKSNGKYLDFVSAMSESSPGFKDAYTQAGMQQASLAATDEEAAKKMADRYRDSLILDLMMKSPSILGLAMQYGEVK